jgi:hypothetical protein
MKDLVILVADSQQRRTLEVLLSERYQSLGIRQPEYDVFTHSGHDPGVYREGGRFLSTFRGQYDYALAVLDAEWDGSPGAAGQIARKVQNDLDDYGWRQRSAVIVIQPELEAWVWSESPLVYQRLGLGRNEILRIANERGLWQSGQRKPMKPKALLEEVLRRTGISRSASLFGNLARGVGLTRCEDPAFRQLQEILRQWFPN